ncbi:MAG: hypothetical protein PHQ19_03585, partial [Candidatus Krumholzibacteria bacterium]|nr:hypothetical protein [Candidatus Krumholzibacteria bacterium]
MTIRKTIHYPEQGNSSTEPDLARSGRMMVRHRRIVFFILAVLLSLLTSCYNFCSSNEQPPARPSSTYPGYAINPYPTDESIGNSKSPGFSWEVKDPGSDDLHYTLTLWNDADEEIWRVNNIPDLYLQYEDTLDGNVWYEWIVLVYDAENNTYTHNVYRWSFKTGEGFNNPPAAPYNPDPPDFQSEVDLPVLLTWDCFDPDGDDITFDVWFAQAGEFKSLIAEGLTETSCDPGELENVTRYNWHVIARDPNGGSNTSKYWYFVTSESPSPDPPHSPFPADGAAGVPAGVTLSWACSDPDGDPLTFDVFMG